MICTKCLIEKDEENFRKIHRHCIDCERERGREYRRNTTKAKEWTENNRDRMAELQHNWYEKNKQKIRDKHNSRYKNDPLFKKAKNHKSALINFIKGKSFTSIFVNCDSIRIRDWLSYQFDDNMTISNYGQYWTVDHVIPVNEFLQGKLPSETIFHWYNIKPVPKSMNLQKNKYATPAELETHLETIKLYTKNKNLDLDIEYISAIKNQQMFLQNTSERGLPKASDTTSLEKSIEGSRLITEPDGNKSEDVTMDNPQ